MITTEEKKGWRSKNRAPASATAFICRSMASKNRYAHAAPVRVLCLAFAGGMLFTHTPD